MLSMEDILSVLFLERLRRKTPLPTESMSLKLANIKCGSGKGSELEYCRDESAALILKFIAITCILFVGATGVSIPLLCKKCRFLRNDGNFFVAAKAFAAGVILATGFVHMLPDATSALTDSCLPSIPWSKFPFSGFFAMMAALLTLVVDFVGTQYYERKQGIGPTVTEQAGGIRVSDSVDADGESGIVSVVVEGKEWNGGEKKVVFGEEEGGRMHIVGIHAHAAHHRHNHPHGQEACYGYARKPLLEGEGQGHGNGGGHTHGHVHSHGLEADDEVDSGIRHVVVSQVLELGIVSHSIIIGLSLGVSQSPCTIRPLIAALSFHQFFEGFALGGCISQAQFKSLSATIMACFFAITTPAGIGVGIAISSFYNPDSPRALITEGIFDSVSAGILVYMALVDLIAADFLSKRMRCNARLQVVSYFALFLGAILMSSLAIWA